MGQTITFLCADLQSRLFLKVLKGEINFEKSFTEQKKEVRRIHHTLAAQFIDRSQLRSQGGVKFEYYEDLAETLGVRPTLWRLLTTRPTAIWHAFFVTWNPQQYRLVGPGRTTVAEQWCEERYVSRFYAPFPDGSPKPHSVRS